MTSRTRRFWRSINSNLSLRFLLGRQAKELLDKHLEEAPAGKEYFFEQLVEKISPPSPEALARALALLVGQGEIERFVRLHSVQGGAQIGEPYASLEEVPEEVFDPNLDEFIRPEKRNLRTIYRKPRARRDDEPPKADEPPPVARFPAGKAGFVPAPPSSPERDPSAGGEPVRRRHDKPARSAGSRSDGLAALLRAIPVILVTYLTDPRELPEELRAAAERLSRLDPTSRRTGEDLYLSRSDDAGRKLSLARRLCLAIGTALIVSVLATMMLLSPLQPTQCQACRVCLALGVILFAGGVRLPGLVDVLPLGNIRLPGSLTALIAFFYFVDICEGLGA